MCNFLLPDVNDWTTWGAIYTDVALWRPVVERLWADDLRLRVATGIEVPQSVEGGYPGTCAVLVVNGSAVVKFYPPQVARDFERERASYATLGQRILLQPVVLAEGVFMDRIAWPYLVLSYLPGRAWRDARALIPPDQAAALMVQFGQIVRSFHEIPLERHGAWPSEKAWEAFVALRLARVGSDLRGGTALPEHVIADVEHLLHKVNWFGSPPTLLNADLTEDHLFLAEQDGRWSLSGLIDWADAEVGDPLYDWVTVWFSICQRDARLFHSFAAGYGSLAGEDQPDPHRLLAVTFLHRFCANILGEFMTVDEQRGIRHVADLQRVMFGNALEN